MLKDLRIKSITGKTKHVGRFESIAAMVEFFKRDLTMADLTEANLTRADLTEANLTRADLTRADLTRANLSMANLSDADMTGANLRWANLTRANLDFSCWPLWCGSFNAIVDRKQKIQILEHALRLIEYNKGDDDLKRILELDFVKNARSEFHHK